jgi:glycosyltransferase involved in cell wall biosynthesis
VGLIIDRKGQFDFLKILQSLDIDYQYWIIGKGPDYEKIEQYVKDEGIQQKVKLLGYVRDTEIYKYHSAADFYSHASYFEAQALSEIEAYSCGLRVVVNKRVSDTVVGDIINDKGNYYVADFNDIRKEEIVAWIKRETDKRVSKKQFDWQVIANMYAKVYEL